jgi:hypothetical protein
MYRNKAKRWVTTATMSLMHKISVIKLLPIPKNNRNMQNKNMFNRAVRMNLCNPIQLEHHKKMMIWLLHRVSL